LDTCGKRYGVLLAIGHKLFLTETPGDAFKFGNFEAALNVRKVSKAAISCRTSKRSYDEQQFGGK